MQPAPIERGLKQLLPKMTDPQESVKLCSPPRLRGDRNRIFRVHLIRIKYKAVQPAPIERGLKLK